MNDASIQRSVPLTALGYFGKYPGYKDFVQHGLPGAFVTHCYDWLGAYMGALRKAAGREWLDVYLTSAVWRFCVLEGAADADRASEGDGWLGALMPSIDAKGRYFPLLAATCVPRVAPVGLLRSLQSMLDELEERMVRCLRQPLISTDALRGHLCGVLPAAAHATLSEPQRQRLAALDDEPSVAALLDDLLAAGSGAGSVWQAKHASDGREVLAAFAGWPSAAELASLQLTQAQTLSDAEVVDE